MAFARDHARRVLHRFGALESHYIPFSVGAGPSFFGGGGFRRHPNSMFRRAAARGLANPRMCGTFEFDSVGVAFRSDLTVA